MARGGLFNGPDLIIIAGLELWWQEAHPDPPCRSNRPAPAFDLPGGAVRFGFKEPI